MSLDGQEGPGPEASISPHLRLLRPWPDNVAGSGQQPRPTGKPRPVLPGLAPNALRLPGVRWETRQPLNPQSPETTKGPWGLLRTVPTQARGGVPRAGPAGPWGSAVRQGLPRHPRASAAPCPPWALQGLRGHRGPMLCTPHRQKHQSTLAGPLRACAQPACPVGQEGQVSRERRHRASLSPYWAMGKTFRGTALAQQPGHMAGDSKWCLVGHGGLRGGQALRGG